MNNKRHSKEDFRRIRQRVNAIQAELAGLQRDLAEPANGKVASRYWSSLRDYWARMRKPVKLYCDSPADAFGARIGDVVRIQGWAIGQAGVESVEIQIDGGAPVRVPHDRPRPDLRDAFPGMPNADKSGFVYEWDTQGCGAASHEIRIRVRTVDGHRAQLKRRVTLSRLADFQIFCDQPLGTTEYAPHSSLPIRGWCASPSPVVHLEFGIDDGPVRKLDYGRPRPEVHKLFPDYPVNCGFEGETGGLSSGEHRLTIAARTRSGNSAVLKQNFFVGALGDDVRLYCDYPGTRGCQSVRDIVQFRGWAVAWSGIQQVTVKIGDTAPFVASFGLPRPDVAERHREFPNAARCGWRFLWDTTNIPEGRYDVRITATSISGASSYITTTVLVDQNCDLEYSQWIARNEPSDEEKQAMAAEIASFKLRPKISIVVPVFKTPPKLLARCIDSVLAQIYSDWELCLADDGSSDPELTRLLAEYQKRDPRIRSVKLEKNLGISAATNAALRLSTGDYVGFLDHDDELADFALWETVNAINQAPSIDLFYSDEDKIDEEGRRYDWFFKPDWSPELFFSCNYLCHFVVLKRAILSQVKGLDETHRGGSQDYDFLLRVVEHTSAIKRIPKILYHWRATAGSTARASGEKPTAGRDGQRALSEYMSRRHPGATVEEVFSCHYRVRYPIEAAPLVDIVMLTGGKMDLLRRCVDDILERTEYPHYQIFLVDNSRSDDVERYAASLASRHAPVRYLDKRWKRFNYALLNNEAVQQSTAPYVLFLNDDMSLVTPEWLTAMLEHAQRKEVGAVGAQLWFPHNCIQHAGVVMGLYGNSGHGFKGLPVRAPGQSQYFDFPSMTRNCSAVTAACLLVSREKFWEVGGFDGEALAVAFQDVDFCLKLLDKGYRNVYTPYAILYHYESATKTEVRPNPVEDHFMKRKWKRYIADDPYYSPNLTRTDEHYGLRGPL